MSVGPLTLAGLAEVVAEHPRFWGERDLRRLHQKVIVTEFGETCLAVRGPDGIRAYLVGFVTPGGTGYVHLVAARDDARGAGLGRRLYGEFSRIAGALGAVRLKAITGLENAGSIAFHRALGFTAERAADYAGPGEDRIVFHRPLAP